MQENWTKEKVRAGRDILGKSSPRWHTHRLKRLAGDQKREERLLQGRDRPHHLFLLISAASALVQGLPAQDRGCPSSRTPDRQARCRSCEIEEVQLEMMVDLGPRGILQGKRVQREAEELMNLLEVSLIALSGIIRTFCILPTLSQKRGSRKVELRDTTVQGGVPVALLQRVMT